MRLLVRIIAIVVGSAIAFAPRSVADDDAIEVAALPAPLDIEALAPAAFDSAPFVGVENAAAFRLKVRNGFLRARPEPLTFAAQAEAGLTAFHLAVYADPEIGRYAKGDARAEVALEQPGLKVVDPEAPDGEALCVTLMLCLSAIDSWSATSGRAEAVAVVIDARRAPRPEPLLLRAAAALVDTPPPAPTWDQLFAEIATALPAIDPERLVIIVAGGRGEIPDRATYFGGAADFVLLDGLEAAVMRADASPEEIGEAVMSGSATVVVGADWSGEGDPSRLGPREAAALGAHVVVVTPRSARAAEHGD